MNTVALTVLGLLAGVALGSPLYQDAAAPIQARVDDLMDRMTLQEKIAQTHAPYSGFNSTRYGQTSVGQLSINPSTGKSAFGHPTAQVAARNKIQQALISSSRLGIPASFSQEALHSGTAGGTVFPELVTQGATWDVELIRDISAAIAVEARATGVDVVFSPVINQWVDARFGRLQEGYSENPTLTAAYAAAAAIGFQGEQPAGKWAPIASNKVVALAKHYAAYGAALGGLNGAPAELSERTLREFYLPSWRAFAKAGGRGAMTAHNTVLNRPCHAHPWLVNTVFREEFEFGDGIIVSDCNDIEALVDFRVAKNTTFAAAAALLGGVDLDLQCGGNSAYTELNTAVELGLLNHTTIDKAARRVLSAKFATGLFDKPLTNPNLVKQLNSAAHQALALRAAEEGTVLLINKNNFLPISASVDDHSRPLRIAVLGPNGGCTSTKPRLPCGAAINMLGSYTQYSDTAGVQVPTVHEALAAYCSDRACEVKYDKGANIGDTNTSQIASAVRLAEASDVAVLVLGDDLHTSSEWGDRDSLDLPGAQLQLLQAVASTETPVVLVTVTGRTPTFGGPENAVLQNVTAMFSAFRPGQMGGVAVANLLFGEANPSGKLAQSWVRSAGQSMSGAAPFLQWRVGKWAANKRGPADPDGRYYDPYNTHAHPTQMTPVTSSEASPLFRFGDGLSYTTFSFGDLMLGAVSHTEATVVVLSVPVNNTGRRAGTEVVQVYCEDPVMQFVRPWKRLVAFSRVTLAAGASTTVEMSLTRDQLMFHDDALVLSLVPGEYTLSVGGSSYSAAELPIPLSI